VRSSITPATWSMNAKPTFQQSVLPVLDLLDAMAWTRFGAGFHLRFLDNRLAMLHLDANLGTFVLVNRMTHAETAPATRSAVRQGRRASQRQGREKDDSVHEPASHVQRETNRVRIVCLARPEQVTEVTGGAIGTAQNCAVADSCLKRCD